MDMRRAAARCRTNGEWIGRRNLVEIIEKRCVAVGGLVVKRRDEWTIDELGKVALSHVGAAYVVVHSVFASGDQPCLVWQRDDSSRSQVLVLMPLVTIGVHIRGEPVADRQRTRVSRVPRKVHNAFSKLIKSELRIVGTVAGNDINFSVVVHRRSRIRHPDTTASTASGIVPRIGTPHVGLRAALRKLRRVVCHYPARGGSCPLTAAECDD